MVMMRDLCGDRDSVEPRLGSEQPLLLGFAKDSLRTLFFNEAHLPSAWAVLRDLVFFCHSDANERAEKQASLQGQQANRTRSQCKLHGKTDK